MDNETFASIYEQDPSLVDSQDAYGYTPLMIAVMSGRTEVADFLIAKGSNLSHVDKDGHNVVHWAVVCGQKAHLLHYSTAAEEIPSDTAIAILHTLLKKGAHVNCVDIDERTPILWAASNGNIEALISLTQAGGDIQTIIVRARRF
ncbi:unnamed protein product, partial [Mesorhabditis spiculigera]